MTTPVRARPSQVFTRISLGSHSSEPRILFDPNRRMWEVALLPTGPGTHSVHFSDTFMRRLAEAYFSNKSADHLTAVYQRILSLIESSQSQETPSDT